MYCHNVPGVVFISLWQVSECASLSNPLFPHCSFSLSHSVLECLQKASILEHSFPNLNPTSDDFILHEYWSSPLVQLSCLYKLAKTLGVNFLCISVLFPLHFKLLSISYFFTYCISNDERFYPYLTPHFLFFH